ncbi:MAG: cytochrome c [Blastocatellia bacterium]|nr:cytochrome c [Blastocatellia bacterium]
MHDQPKYIPMRSSAFFDDGTSARTPVAGTVARGQLREDEHLYTGKTGQQFAATFPFEITSDMLNRGQEQYDIFCSVCHDRTGAGNGMIVQRGFRRPPSFHIDRLRESPPGYFFDVITNGFGAMSDYSAQITPEDRWKIIAYIRALQLSRNATIEDLPPEERDKLNRGGQTR